MIKFIRKILILSAAGLASALPSLAARNWEALKTTDRLQQSRVVKSTVDIEVRSAGSTIIVTTNRPVTVRVFSILGQLISQENIPAGTSMLELNMHGVFIVKIGELTCKVAL